jgi:hypothetical protein
MTGLYLLVVAGIWLAIVLGVSRLVTTKLSTPRWRDPIRVLTVVALLALPLIDEIVGGQQFEQLCEENSTIQVDRATARGKTVYFTPQPDREIKGTWVRIVLQPRRFVDATTGDTVISFNDLVAEGGRFIRTLGISEGGVPLTFKGWCHPGDQFTLRNLLKELNITAIRKPE